jgi:hypothetical protein
MITCCDFHEYEFPKRVAGKIAAPLDKDYTPEPDSLASSLLVIVVAILVAILVVFILILRAQGYREDTNMLVGPMHTTTRDN